MMQLEMLLVSFYWHSAAGSVAAACYSWGANQWPVASQVTQYALGALMVRH